jgi:abhydrolase domain-containing protein 4
MVEQLSSVRVKGQPTLVVLSPQEIEGASHHVYADQPHIFNAVVEEICDSVD